MITTLKITVIFAAVVCISLVGFVGAFGLRGDPDIEKLLDGPRVIQQLKDLVTKAPSTEGQTSPLVKQAHEFALRIDPPPPPEPPKPPIPKGAIPTPKDPDKTITDVTPPPPPPSKFDLIATCRYEDNPSRSMALVDLPGKGLKWFRVGENIEHLVLADVLDGSISVTQGGRSPQTVAMKPEKPLARNLLLEEGQELPTPTTTALTYEPVKVPATPPPLGRGNAYFAPEGGNRALPAGSTTTPPGLSSARKPPSTTIARQPRTYVPPSRPRTPAPEQTADQRKAVLEDNIADLKSIMAQPNAEADKAEVAEEQAALAKLLELLEEERKQAVEQSKVTTAAESKPKQGE